MGHFRLSGTRLSVNARLGYASAAQQDPLVQRRQGGGRELFGKLRCYAQDGTVNKCGLHPADCPWDSAGGGRPIGRGQNSKRA